MLSFENRITIDRPVNEVFCFATRLENNAKWQSDIIVAEQISDGPFDTGALCRLINRFIGQRYESEFIVSAFEPYRKCSYRFVSGPMSGESSFLFEPVNGNGSTLFTTKGKLELVSFKMARFLVERKAKQQIRTDMKRLKDLLENQYDGPVYGDSSSVSSFPC